MIQEQFDKLLEMSKSEDWADVSLCEELCQNILGNPRDLSKPWMRKIDRILTSIGKRSILAWEYNLYYGNKNKTNK